VNNSYLERAKKAITDPQILSIVASKRARQLAMGARPMLKCDTVNHLDIALLEIAEGKLYYTHGEKPEVDIFADITESSKAVAETAVKPVKSKKAKSKKEESKEEESKEEESEDKE